MSFTAHEEEAENNMENREMRRRLIKSLFGKNGKQ